MPPTAPPRQFLRNLGTVVTGSVAAQAAALAAMPLLTRLYDPALFGAFGLVAALAGLAAMIATGRWELAIVLPEREEDAAGVAFLALLAAFASSLGVVVVIALAGPWLPHPELLWWLPAMMLVAASADVLAQWNLRRERYHMVAHAHGVRAAVTVTVQVTAGFAAPAPAGLLAGQILGYGAQAGELARRDGTAAWPRMPASGLAGLIALARRYREFPLYGAPQALVNALSQYGPVVVLAAAFGEASVGFYWLALRVLSLPDSVLNQPLRQVFYRDVRDDLDHLRQRLARTTLALAAVGLPVLLAAVLAGPALFAWAFGAEWETAGAFARWLAPWWFLGFVNVPCVAVIPLLRLQGPFLAYEVALGAARLGALLLGAAQGDALTAVAAYALAGALFNAALIAFIFHAARPERVRA
ncbi:MAG TPA: oligosaccharide flippase family protein [Azospirillum sp.]|nr:oligosaccharide flippase family protein [Azospirillum sp.]